jgi:hypothetical protein
VAEHIGQIGQRVDLVHLATFEETVIDGGRSAGVLGADEEKILSVMDVFP